MKNNIDFYQQAKRYQDEYVHMSREISSALDLLTMIDAPNRISREERIESALKGLQRAKRYVDGEDKSTIWTC